MRIKGFSENKRIQGIIRKWIWKGLVKFNIVQWFIDVSEYKKNSLGNITGLGEMKGIIN